LLPWWPRNGQRADVVFERWQRARRAALAALRAADPDRALAWVAAPVKPATLATTRLAEHWAHGLDITGPLSLDFPDSDRLRHVAWLAHRTLPYAMTVAGEQPAPVRCELTAPDGGSVWEFGPAEAESGITGPAGDFCRVAARRLAPASSRLSVSGPQAPRRCGWRGPTQVRHLAAADLGLVQVGGLGRVQVAGANQHDPVLAYRLEVEPAGDQLGAVAGEQAQHHAGQVARRACLWRLHVTVGVEPDDRRPGSGGLQPGDGAERGETVTAGHDHRASVGGAIAGHSAGHGGVQHGEPRPDLGSGYLGRRQLGGDQFRGVGTEVKVGQVLVQVVGHADDGHPPTLTDGANTGR